MNNTLKKIVLEIINIEGWKVYDDKWNEIDEATFEACIGVLLLALVYKSHS